MGEQSCIVVISMLTITVAVIINVIAFGAPRWVAGLDKASGGGENATEVTKGLWQICINDDCEMLNATQQEVWFKAVQGVFSVGTGLCILTMVVFCSIFAVNMTTEKMYLIVCCVLFTNIISSVCFATAIGVFGTNAREDPPVPDIQVTVVERKLDWAFYVAIWGAVFSLISTVLLIWEGCLASSWFKVTPYYDI